MADGHAFSVTRIWVLLDTSDDIARVTHVFGVDEHLPPDAVPLYQGHQIVSSTQARVQVSRVMENPRSEKNQGRQRYIQGDVQRRKTTI